MDEESDESSSPLSDFQSFSKNNNETSFQNTSRTMSDIDSMRKFNSFEDSLFQRTSRSNNHLNGTHEMEHEIQNLPLQHTTSADSIISRTSRNFSRHSPLGSFRSIRNSTRRDFNNRNGVNIIMVIGFSILIAFGYLFGKIESLLKWFQCKFNELHLQIFEGRSIREFYAQEKSTTRKWLYGPLGGLCYVLQTLVYLVLKLFEILKKPAPKGLVRSVLDRYLKE